jgi:CRISPR/Cas system-associated exonuclease Cas4 (RecB family)
VPSIAALRHAPWSLSKIQCALRCPLEFHFRYVARIAEPEVATELRLGKAVHAALEAVLLGKPIPEAMDAGSKEVFGDEEQARLASFREPVTRFLSRIEDFRRRHRVVRELVEHRLAVTFDFSPVDFLAPDAFFRGVWDAGYFFDEGALAVVDHKTGIKRDAADYAGQLEGYAALAAANMPGVRKIWLGVHFVPAASMEWTKPVDLDEVRGTYTPRLLATIEAAARAVAGEAATAKPSKWCARCSYRSICPAMRTPPSALPDAPAELVDDKGGER